MTKTIISTLAGLSLLISWLIPHHYNPWLTSDSEFLAFIAALLLCPLLFNAKITLPRISIFIAICALIPIIQWAFGVIFFLGDAVIVSSYLLGLATAIMLGHNFAGNESTRNKAYMGLASVLIIGSVISTWLAFRQWLQFDSGFNSFSAYIPPNSGYRPFANFGQPNNLATLLCMGLASVWYLFERHLIGRTASSLLAGFLICGVTLTQSRTPWVGAFFVLVWWAWKSRFLTSRLSWLSLIVWITLYVGLILSLPIITDYLGVGEVDLAGHAQAFERLGLWQQFSLAVIDGPWWGYGWNQVSVAQLAMSNVFPVAQMTNSSHNILLDLLVWNGPVVGMLMIAVIGVWIFRLGYSARNQETIFGLMTVGFVLIHGMLEYPLCYAYFLLPVGFLLGLSNRQLTQIGVPPLPRFKWIAIPDFTLPRIAFASFLVVSVSCMAWIGQEYSNLDKNYQERASTQTAGTSLSSEGHAVLLTQLRDRLRLKHSDPTARMTAQQLDWTRNVAYRYPQIANLYHYAAALALNNQPTQAKLELTNLRALYGETVYTNALNQLAALEKQTSELSTPLMQNQKPCRHHRKHTHCQSILQ
ncbi:Wzy polymerase domain-containing protein [Aquirhabdus sp.]|uniref:PglL family O-oligosaccharyltransferase n=1 Tax=Aquirhabdus sp. TaxID=2824160 RepID=UPI00396D02AC